MILIVSRDVRECEDFRSKIASHYEAQCWACDWVDLRGLQSLSPDMIIVVCKDIGGEELRAFRAIRDSKLPVSVVLFTESTAKLPGEIEEMPVVVGRDFPKLVDIISAYDLEEADWGRIIHEVCRFARENIAAIESVDEIPAELNLRARKLKDEFKRETGLTLKQYVDTERMQKVRMLLKETPHMGNYYSLAVDAGFRSISALEKFLKKRTGMTAKEYHGFILGMGSR